jgi:hypothetical protein
MRDTAADLEAAEDVLHHSADEAPNPGTAVRLDALGDAVTAQAKNIARRADNLPEPSDAARPGART